LRCARPTLLTANSADLRDAVMPLGADLRRFDMIIYGADPAALRPDTTGVAAGCASLAMRRTRLWRCAWGAWCPRRASTC
jgi:hypothetical protein